MHNIEWTQKAVDSYNGLIARKQFFETALDQILEKIQLMPLSFPIDKLSFSLQRAVINNRHILYYTIKPNGQVDLILFFDTKGGPPKLRQLLQ